MFTDDWISRFIIFGWSESRSQVREHPLYLHIQSYLPEVLSAIVIKVLGFELLWYDDFNSIWNVYGLVPTDIRYLPIKIVNKNCFWYITRVAQLSTEKWIYAFQQLNYPYGYIDSRPCLFYHNLVITRPVFFDWECEKKREIEKQKRDWHFVFWRHYNIGIILCSRFPTYTSYQEDKYRGIIQWMQVGTGLRSDIN